jgi:hypothetical protein
MEQTWDSKVNAHTSAMDEIGRVYYAAPNRSPKEIPAQTRSSPLVVEFQPRPDPLAD